MFPLHKRISLQRLSTLKFPPLQSKFFSCSLLHTKNEVKHLNSTLEQTESRHARKKSRRDSNVPFKTRQPYPEIASRCTQSRHDFPSAKNIHSAKKIASRHSKSRHDFEFPESQIWRQFSTVMYNGSSIFPLSFSVHRLKLVFRSRFLTTRCSSVSFTVRFDLQKLQFPSYVINSDMKLLDVAQDFDLVQIEILHIDQYS